MGYLTLFKHFHSVYLSTGDVSYFINLSKTTFSELTYNNEIGNGSFNSKDIMLCIVNRADSLRSFDIMRPRCT